MYLPRPLSKLALRSVLAASWLVLAWPGLAHNVEVAEGVAATMHMEPNHNPKSGEPALTWFALTRQGGQLIPLTECDCQLAVYPEPRRPDTKPVLQPALTAINAEQYRGIPGTQIIFPTSGRYNLELSGRPKAGAEFKPFKLSYPVTVIAGTVAASPQPATSPTAQSAAGQSTAESAQAADGFSPWLPVGGLAIGLGIAATLWLKRQHK